MSRPKLVLENKTFRTGRIDKICTVAVRMTSTEATTSSNGTATAHVTLEQGNVTYLWSDGQTTPTATGLSAGAHTVTVKDDFSEICQAVGTVTIVAGNAAISASSNSDSTPTMSLTYTGTGLLEWSDGTDTFTPALVFGVSIVTWINWTDTSVKTFTVRAEEPDKITIFGNDWNAQSLVGELNVVETVSIEGAFDISSNGGLTSVVHGISSGAITNYLADNTGLTSLNVSNLDINTMLRVQECPDLVTFVGEVANTNNLVSVLFYTDPSLLALDISGYTNIGNEIWVYECTSMVTLDLPAVSAVITRIRIHSCTSLLAIDFKGMTIRTRIDFFGCTSLLTFDSDANSEVITEILGHDCTSLQVMDLSVFTGLENNVRVHGNTVMRILLIPNSTGVIKTLLAYDGNLFNGVDFTGCVNLGKIDGAEIWLFNNNMDAAGVNLSIVTLAAIYATEGPGGDFINRELRIETNAAPDATSGGNDGIQGVIDLVDVGFVVTTA